MPNLSFRKKFKELLQPKDTGHNIHTKFSDISRWLNRFEINSNQTFGIISTVEFAIILIEDFGIDPKKIWLYGDSEEKKKIAHYLEINYNDMSLFLEEKIKMKFTYTLMNPAFDISMASLKKAKSITTEKVLFIGPTRDFDKNDMLNDIECYEPLGGKAFDENILTAMAVYDVNGTNKTEIKFQNGSKKIIKDIKVVPGIDNRDEWEFACDILSKNLPGYDAEIGKLEYSKSREDVNGTLCIFTVGKEDSDEWGNHRYIPDEQLDFTKGRGKHKMVVSKTGSIGKIGALKYAGPEIVCGFGTYFIEFTSKQEVLDNIDYIKSDPVRKLVKGIKSNTVVNGQRIWSAIPKMEYKKQWI